MVTGAAGGDLRHWDIETGVELNSVHVNGECCNHSIKETHQNGVVVAGGLEILTLTLSPILTKPNNSCGSRVGRAACLGRPDFREPTNQDDRPL